MHIFMMENPKDLFSATYCDFSRLGRSELPHPSLWLAPAGMILKSISTIALLRAVRLSILSLYQLKQILKLLTAAGLNRLWISVFRFNSKIVKTHGLRNFMGCWFDKNVTISASQDLTFKGNVFYGGIWSAGSDTRWALFDSNLLRLPGSDGNSSMLAEGDMNNIYFLHDGSGVPVRNPHYCNFTKNLPGEFIIENCIFECPFYDTTSDVGDCMLFDGYSTAQIVTMKHCIGLPINPNYTGNDTNSSGTAFSIFSSSSGINFKFNKNTFYGGLQHGICTMGEGVEPFYGKVSSFKDNLFWDNIDAGSERAFAIRTDATNAVDRFEPYGVTNNGWWRLKKTDSQLGMSSQGTIYDVPTTGIIPGKDDINRRSSVR